MRRKEAQTHLAHSFRGHQAASYAERHNLHLLKAARQVSISACPRRRAWYDSLSEDLAAPIPAQAAPHLLACRACRPLHAGSTC